MRHTWHFLYDDGVWDCSATPSVDSNLSRAIETLADSFGTQAVRVRRFQRYWAEASGEDGLTVPVNTTTASLHPVDAKRVEIHDKYRQFTNVEIEAEDLEAALLALIREMLNRFEQRE